MRDSRDIGLLTRAAHLAVLWAFAVVQPLFQAVGAEFFLNDRPRDVVLFAIALTVVPPSALALAEAVVGRVSAVARNRVHLVFVAGLAAIFGSQLLASAGTFSSEVRMIVSAAIGLGFAAAYRAAAPVRLVLTVLTPAVVLVLALFLFSSAASRVILATEDTAPLHSPRSRTPVVLLLLDELPVTSLLDASGQIDGERFPNFAAFARGATWFPNATTIHDSTLQAIPAILTGVRTKRGALPVAAGRPGSVFTLLGGSYRIHASETNETHICPERLCPRTALVSFPQRMRSLFREGARVSIHQWLPERLADDLLPDVSSDLDPRTRLARFLPGVRPTPGPALHLLHLLLPHQPWRYLPSGKTYPRPRLSPFVALRGVDSWPRNPAYALSSYQRHLLQLLYTDRVLGALLRRLRATGLFDRSLVIVMADHGVSFRPGDGPRLASQTNAPDILTPPLIVKLPHQRAGRISRRFVRTVDVVPTIADTLNTPIPFPTDGKSVFATNYGGRKTVSVSSRRGGVVTRSTAALIRAQEQALRRRLGFFGSGDARRVYWLGANSDLLGRGTAGLHAGLARATRATVEAPGALSSLDLDARSLPARIAGTVSGPAVGSGTQIAVGVNGRLVAATRAYSDHGRVRFVAMVPEGSLRDGRNELAFYTVGVRGGRRVVERLPA